MLLNNNIHIDAILETHIPHDLSYTHNGYRIVTSSATKEANRQRHRKIEREREAYPY